MAMDEQDKKTDKIQAFDSLFTTNQLQICKLLLSYLKPSMQKSMAVYIKYMELQYTLAYFSRHHDSIFPSVDAVDTDHICKEILPFCSPTQKQQVEQLTGLFGNLKNITELMDTLYMIKELFPEGFSFDDASDGSMSDIAQLLQMFGSSV